MKHLLIHFTAFVAVISSGGSALAQQLQERLIIKDTRESLMQNSGEICFSENGAYCIKVSKKGKNWFYTNTDTLGPFTQVDAIYGSNGQITFTCAYNSECDSPWYFKNSRGTSVYGPVKGKLVNSMDSDTRNNMAITVRYRDSVYYYANDKLVWKAHKYEPGQKYADHEQWCSFSPAGNYIYYRADKNAYYLNTGDVVRDTANSTFKEMRINDNGDFIFGEGHEPLPVEDEYDHLFYIHNRDTVLGPVRTVWKNDLGPDGGYYYSGDDNGTTYIAINNRMYRNQEDVSNVRIADRNNDLFVRTANGKKEVVVNGAVFAHAFQQVYCPVITASGHFAYYGMKDYYLYKVIDGKQAEQPITRYGVRPVPLYISPEGVSVHYFKTDDSIYVYRDDKLLFPPVAVRENFFTQFYDESMSTFKNEIAAVNRHALWYIEAGKTAYWLYDGMLSKPMTPDKERFSRNEKSYGTVMAKGMNKHGFYVIQQIGAKRYIINVNNTTYHELTGVENILKDNCFFDGKSLVFYGIKNNAFYQYTLKP